MTRFSLARYVSPWSSKREKERQQRVAELRSRDGDNCRRCRRPLRFDLPAGHEKAPTILNLAETADGEPVAIDNLVLCHGRCNAGDADLTGEVTERVRRKNEAELFAKAKKRA
jgi:5-methylcytosine-specific restriction endonuclease McrA